MIKFLLSKNKNKMSEPVGSLSCLAQPLIAALPDRERQGLGNLGYPVPKDQDQDQDCSPWGGIFDLNPQGMKDISHVLISLVANDTCPFENVRGGGGKQ